VQSKNGKPTELRTEKKHMAELGRGPKGNIWAEYNCPVFPLPNHIDACHLESQFLSALPALGARTPTEEWKEKTYAVFCCKIQKQH